MDLPPLTNSQINRAGRALRRWGTDPEAPADALETYLARELDLLIRFRAAHQVPLAKATRGLRRMVRTEGARAEITHRLKRVPTIVDKLCREPTMKIEVQLRTRVMHDWAIGVERVGGRLQADLKSGRGPEPLLAWLGLISEAMALEEAGQTVDARLAERIAMLREGALPYFQEASS